MLVNFSDFAKLKKVSLPAVSQAVKRGRLDGCVVNQNGKRLINAEQALKQWDENLFVRRAPKTKEEVKAHVQELPDDAIPDFNTSRTRKEHYQAELARIQVEQQEGKLIEASQVEKSAFAMGRAVRESLSNLADRLAYQVAGETDPQVIHRMLSDEHRNALEKLVTAQ